MRRPLLARRILAIGFASGAIALAGCPAPSNPPVTDPGPQTVEVETETVEVIEAEEPAADPDGPSSATRSAEVESENDPPSVETEASTEEAAPAVILENPRDFLRPTLPDAALAAEEEPADPPEAITDSSAEAKDPNVLPGGTPIGDLFEGLDDEPAVDAGN